MLIIRDKIEYLSHIWLQALDAFKDKTQICQSNEQKNDHICVSLIT